MEEVPWYVSLIVSWLPLILFIVMMVWLGRRLTRELRTADGRALATVIEEYARELKRSNDHFGETLADHGKRLEAVEKE